MRHPPYPADRRTIHVEAAPRRRQGADRGIPRRVDCAQWVGQRMVAEGSTSPTFPSTGSPGKVPCSPTGTGSRAAPPGAPRCSRETDHDDHHPRPGGSNDEAMLCARHTRGGRTLGPGCGPSGHGADGRAARAAVRPRGHGAGARRQAPLRPLRRPLRGRPGDDPAAVAVAARRHRGGDEELPDLAPGDRRAHGRGR